MTREGTPERTALQEALRAVSRSTCAGPSRAGTEQPR